MVTPILQATLIMALFLRGQDPTLADLLRDLSSDQVETRNHTEAAILNRWRQWSDPDLQLLANAARSGERELAARSGACLETIRFYQKIPDKIWKLDSKAGRTLRQGTAEEVAELFTLLQDRWNDRELRTSEIMPVVIGALGDQRPTGGRGRPIPVSDYAYSLLYDAIPRFNFQTKPEAVQQWWEEHRSRPEREWYLPELNSPREGQRSRAIQRLFALEEMTLHPALFEALRTVKDEDNFLTAARDVSRLPRETIQRELKVYLNDPRPEARLLAAKALLPLDRRAAIDSLFALLERPAALRTDPGVTSPQYKLVNWLASTKDERALGILRTLLKNGDFGVKHDVLSALLDLDDSVSEHMILEGLSDTDRSPEEQVWGEIRNPRICDISGWLLAKRMTVGHRYAWRDPTDHRDKTLSEIWTLYRERRGMPLVPFLTPGTTVVKPEEVAALLPALASEEDGPRRQAIKSLSQLGGGAWLHLQAGIRQSQGPVRKRLEEAAQSFSNTLRAVTVDDDSTQHVKGLLEHLHEPLDLDALLKDTVNPWFGDSASSQIRLDVSREPGGRGIRIRVYVSKDGAGQAGADHLSWHFRHTISARLRRDLFDHAWEEYFGVLRLHLQHGNEEPFHAVMDMSKTRED